MVFRVLHGLHLAAFCFACRQLFSTAALNRLPFFGCLFALFLLPGALFEYGTDMWFQFERNFAFGQAPTIADSMRPDRFGFFFGHTFFGWVEPGSRRLAMTLYGAGTSTLLSYQFFRLARTLGFGELTARLAVLSVVLLLGTAQLSFFRDYAISSTPLAHTAYLALIGLLIEAMRDKQWHRLYWVPAAAVVMLANHPQTALFTVAVLPALILATAAHGHPERITPIFRWSLVVLIFGSVGGALFMRFALPHLSETSQTALAYLSPWGAYPLWDLSTHVFATLSLTGLAAAIWAVWRWAKNPCFSALAIAPLYFLLFPPSQIPFTLFLGHYDLTPETLLGAPHRLIFAFPAVMLLPLALREALLRGGLQRRWIPAAVACSLILVALTAAPPFFGKFWNLVHRSDAIDRAYFPETLEWFLSHPERPHAVGLLTDRASALGIFLATVEHGSDANVSKAQIQEVWPTRESEARLPPALIEFWQVRLTGFLLVDPQVDLHPAVSPFGFVYPSIRPSETLKHLSASQHFARRHLVELTSAGWEATPVPPFFILLEPPRQGGAP